MGSVQQATYFRRVQFCSSFFSFFFLPYVLQEKKLRSSVATVGAVRQTTYLSTRPFLFLCYRKRNYKVIYYGGSSTSCVSFDASIFVPLIQEKKRNYEIICYGGCSTGYVSFGVSIILPRQEKKKEITKLAAVGAVRQAV